jgi:hypothetical protein
MTDYEQWLKAHIDHMMDYRTNLTTEEYHEGYINALKTCLHKLTSFTATFDCPSRESLGFKND